jgi:hypothetical protein
MRSLLCTRLRAMARIQMQMATALTTKGQDELRKHFIESAGMMIEAVKEMEA